MNFIFVVVLLCQVFLTYSFRAGHIFRPKIEISNRGGIRVSLPDTPGLEYFSFNANVEVPIDFGKIGEISGEIFEPINGRWTIRDPDAQLENGNKLYYWIKISRNGVERNYEGVYQIKMGLSVDNDRISNFDFRPQEDLEERPFNMS